MIANFSCSLCDSPALLFCPVCDHIYCCRCAETHKLKDVKHTCENLEARNLMREMGRKDFQVRRDAIKQAESFLSQLEVRANETIRAVREGLERAYLQNNEMVEALEIRLEEVLKSSREDLRKAWLEVHPLFASQLTEKVLECMGQPPDAFEATETYTHMLTVVNTTASFYAYFREVDIDRFERKLLDLLVLRSAPHVSELEKAVNSFLLRQYLPNHATPNAEATLQGRLPILVPRQVALSLSYCETNVALGHYFGQVNAENKPAGYGALIMIHDGSRAYPFRNGDVYIGEFTAGQITGEGLMVYADGTLYEGQWECAERSGHGLLQWPDGSRYQGDLLRGQRHGQGCLTYSDRSKYEGGWMRDKRHHWGVYSKGRTRCEGEWQADSFVEAGLEAGFYPSA